MIYCKHYNFIINTVKSNVQYKQNCDIIKDMRLLIYILGKSASGKDTVFNKLLENELYSRLIIYTTRPIRVGEVDGETYNYVSEEYMNSIEDDKIIEKRVYHTVLGDWYYFTVDDGQFENNDILIGIGTLESLKKVNEYFGRDKIMPVYIEVPDEIRLERAINREKLSDKPNIDEVNRRYMADNIDFSDEKLQKLGVKKRYINLDIDECLKEINNDIGRELERI